MIIKSMSKHHFRQSCKKASQHPHLVTLKPIYLIQVERFHAFNSFSVDFNIWEADSRSERW